MKPMSEETAQKWQKTREKGFLFYLRVPIILLIVNVFLLLLFSFWATSIPSYLVTCLLITPFCILIGGTFDWWRYEKKYQLYKYPKF